MERISHTSAAPVLKGSEKDPGIRIPQAAGGGAGGPAGGQSRRAGKGLGGFGALGAGAGGGPRGRGPLCPGHAGLRVGAQDPGGAGIAQTDDELLNNYEINAQK